MVPHCIMCSIWREQNERCFEGVEESIGQVCSLMFCLLFIRSNELATLARELLPFVEFIEKFLVS